HVVESFGVGHAEGYTAVPLRIGIDKKDATAGGRKSRCEIDGGGCLAGSPLLIQHGDASLWTFRGGHRCTGTFDELASTIGSTGVVFFAADHQALGDERHVKLRTADAATARHGFKLLPWLLLGRYAHAPSQ